MLRMRHPIPHVAFRLSLFFQPLVEKLPKLNIVMEHITTSEAVAFVTAAPANVAATITPQHLLYNRNAIFQVRWFCCLSFGVRATYSLSTLWGWRKFMSRHG